MSPAEALNEILPSHQLPEYASIIARRLLEEQNRRIAFYAEMTDAESIEQYLLTADGSYKLKLKMQSGEITNSGIHDCDPSCVRCRRKSSRTVAVSVITEECLNAAKFAESDDTTPCCPKCQVQSEDAPEWFAIGADARLGHGGYETCLTPKMAIVLLRSWFGS